MKAKILVLIIGCVFCLLACDGSSPVPIQTNDVPDLSGYYLITGGTETFAEVYQGQHYFSRTEFTVDDGVLLTLSQNGSIMEMFHCMGMYRGGSVVCDFTEPIQWQGNRGAQKIEGSILFEADRAFFDVWVHREYAEIQYVSNNVLKLELQFAGETPASELE